jgi:DNA polymerase-1
MLGRDFKDKDTVAVVVGMPTEFDEEQAKAFSGSIWAHLYHILTKNGIDSNAWVYAQACRSTGHITLSEEKRCHKGLIEYLKECGAKYALLVGDKATRIFSNGQIKALKKARGTTIHVDGIVGVPVYDYIDVMRDREMEETFLADLIFFRNLSSGKFETFNYTKLDPALLPNFHKRNVAITKAECVAYDLETEGLDHRKGKVKMLGLAWRYEDMYFTGIIYPQESPFKVPDNWRWSWEQINDLFKSINKTVAHNSKFDNGWLISRGVHVQVNFDTMLASHCENNLTPSTLKFLAKKELNAPNYEEGIDHEDLSEETRIKMQEYCQLDCYFTLRLREEFLKQGLKYRNVKISADYKKPFAKILMPGTRVLEQIEQRGIYISRDKLNETKIQLKNELQEYKAKLDSLLPKGLTEINYDSPTQLRKLLYSKEGFGYKPIYIGKDANPDEDDPTTGKPALKKLARQGSEFAKVLLEYRQRAKALSAFIYPWLDMLDENNRLYPKYTIGRTATGRLSAYDPNLQQVSRDKRIRNLVSATPGYMFVEADYSQIELRVAAWLGRISSMIKIYNENGDIHTNTAKSIAQLAGLDWDSLDKTTQKEYRTRAKAVNFGFIYGMGWEGFMDYADASYDVVLTPAEAKHYREVYFNLYPELLDWHARSKQEVTYNKCIITPFGRLRRLPNIDSIDNYLRGKAIRCGVNTPVQSTASDFTLLSMIDLEREFSKYPDIARIVGQCHDAIFFEIREDKVNEIVPIIYHIMTHPRLEEFDLYMDVPIDVEIKIGTCWGDANAVVYDPQKAEVEL